MVRSTKVANDRHKPHFNPQTQQLGEDMQIGDLVRRIKLDNHLKQDPRIGIVQDTIVSHPDGKLVCVVQWHNGQAGHYFNTCLEALCK